MYNYFFPKAILQRFSSFHTTFWKQTLQTTDIGNFVICLISHILIGLTVCYFVIPKISSRPDHWCQKVFLAKKVIYDILEAQRRYMFTLVHHGNKSSSIVVTQLFSFFLILSSNCKQQHI